ncbi:putative bifunctional inhibitor/plant lipid transfer protein/seed storage helical [Lupinus albus]|uniref:Putative bifunctional inhibitor/plant lipid transfer protein/seed storage helical n=1 Tax=Lupinus albus TaxID=3870 RepID=A0A6A4PDL1_LUPAL|nr:putative bifunctional inhibitor/plant lipid transfer protein/seed storage helical [Lupinus albus]
MASKAALLISLNILFFTLVTSTSASNPSPSTPADPIESTNAPNPLPSTPSNPIESGNCSVDPFKFKVCALFSWVQVPYWNPCCSLIAGLEDSEAAVCLCTASKIKFLGFPFNIPLNYPYILSSCGQGTLNSFACR